MTVKEIAVQTVNMGGVKIDLQSSEALTQKRCSRCHDLDRVVGARKDARGWVVTVNNMRVLPGSGISETDARNHRLLSDFSKLCRQLERSA